MEAAGRGLLGSKKLWRGKTFVSFSGARKSFPGKVDQVSQTEDGGSKGMMFKRTLTCKLGGG